MGTPGKAKAPAFQFYVRDWLSDERVALMSLEEQGAYVRLLCHQWLEGSIPNDLKAIARLCQVDGSAMAQLWVAIGPCFAPTDVDGRRANVKLEEQRIRQEEFRQERSKTGKKGAAKRWNSDELAIGSAMAQPLAQPMAEPIANDSSAVCSLLSADLTTEQQLLTSEPGGSDPSTLPQRPEAEQATTTAGNEDAEAPATTGVAPNETKAPKSPRTMEDLPPEALSILETRWIAYAGLEKSCDKPRAKFAICAELDRLHRLDGHPWDEIGAVVEFAAKHWRPKGFMLSPAKLRDRKSAGDPAYYDQVLDQMRRSANGHPNGNGHAKSTSPPRTSAGIVETYSRDPKDWQ